MNEEHRLEHEEQRVRAQVLCIALVQVKFPRQPTRTRRCLGYALDGIAYCAKHDERKR